MQAFFSMRKLTFSISFLLWSTLAFTQGSEVPLNSDAYHILERLRIKTGVQPNFHTSLKYYTRGDVARYALRMDTVRSVLSSKDRHDIFWLYKDNNEWLDVLDVPTTNLNDKNQRAFEKEYIDSNKVFYTYKLRKDYQQVEQSDKYIYREKPILNFFYKTPANLIEVNERYFKLRLNPILNFRIAKEQGEEELNFFNQRGIRLRGVIDDRIWFSANILETQARFANYINERIGRDLAVPGAGFYKNFNSTVFNSTNAFDYLNGQGHVGFNATKHFSMQLGHGQHFIGNGYRSLILSDFANNYFYLKLNWRVWKFHYQNLFTELAVEGNRNAGGDGLLGKKYMATHHLSINLTKNLNVGVFETVIFNRNNNFELQYLNPIILYRTVEQMIGSPDNVLAGIDFRWDFMKRFSLYGQLVLDEFKFDELFIERRGWWANKYGIQAGLKYIDAFGIDHLDAQAEFNLVRPFMYTHRDSSATVAHYNQPLAHPQGANFKEYIFRLRYQPIAKPLVLNASVIYTDYGEDIGGNYGSNILSPSGTRVNDFGNEIGQGANAKQMFASVNASYQFFHNMYFEVFYQYRNKESAVDSQSSKTGIIGGGVRMNIDNRPNDF